MHNRLHLLLSLLLIIVSTSACASQPYIGYAGKQLPVEEVAVIEPEIGIEIHTVDAKVVDIKNEAGGDTGKYHSAVVLPGQYSLGVIPQYRTAVKTVVRLQVTVAAGRKYLVRHKNVNRDSETEAVYEIWVEDAVTREVVSNRATSQNPFRPVDKSKLSTSHQ
jgi:hypothetical protein